MGYAKTKKEVLALVERLLAEKGHFIAVSIGWWQSFQLRHPTLTLRTAENLSYSRLNPEIINQYVDFLQQTLVDNDLIDSPSTVTKLVFH